ncbi:sterile alpha motif domain-containing protein 1-like [Equus przewalskii]|uniref:Sterile alpha motif domain-containing protein 1-like n=1 Tax=Equus przewalskii TaxID=9798 RepID=A0ABM4M0U2_EQUPR
MPRPCPRRLGALRDDDRAAAPAATPSAVRTAEAGPQEAGRGAQPGGHPSRLPAASVAPRAVRRPRPPRPAPQHLKPARQEAPPRAPLPPPARPAEASRRPAHLRPRPHVPAALARGLASRRDDVIARGPSALFCFLSLASRAKGSLRCKGSFAVMAPLVLVGRQTARRTIPDAPSKYRGRLT